MGTAIKGRTLSVKMNRRGAGRHVDNPQDVKMQNDIKSRANYSLGLLGMAFVKNGSGRFLPLRAGVAVKRKPA